ncbi:hypothetical protein V2G26_012740 [Clonostachys chloroleuca]
MQGTPVGPLTHPSQLPDLKRQPWKEFWPPRCEIKRISSNSGPGGTGAIPTTHAEKKSDSGSTAEEKPAQN